MHSPRKSKRPGPLPYQQRLRLARDHRFLEAWRKAGRNLHASTQMAIAELRKPPSEAYLQAISEIRRADAHFGCDLGIPSEMFPKAPAPLRQPVGTGSLESPEQPEEPTWPMSPTARL